jgi:glycosyltransferase involved in cell wall biosynthesis
MKISACIITFNQEKYIEDCILNALSQRVYCEYEIVIGDDCSTDNTSLICQKYADAYPSLIKYHRRNNNIGMMKNWFTTLSECSGSYIALCEGDDFWSDPEKLQLQLGILQSQSEISACFHSSYTISSDKNFKNKVLKPDEVERFFNVSEIVERGGDFFSTNSLFFRSDVLNQMPTWLLHAPVADFPFLIYLALSGKVFYLNKCMSVYRIGADNSWTNTTSKSYESLRFRVNQINLMLDQINHETDFVYDSAINSSRNRNTFFYLLASQNFYEAGKAVYKSHYTEYYRSLSYLQKLKFLVIRFSSSIKI